MKRALGATLVGIALLSAACGRQTEPVPEEVQSAPVVPLPDFQGDDPNAVVFLAREHIPGTGCITYRSARSDAFESYLDAFIDTRCDGFNDDDLWVYALSPEGGVFFNHNDYTEVPRVDLGGALRTMDRENRQAAWFIDTYRQGPFTNALVVSAAGHGGVKEYEHNLGRACQALFGQSEATCERLVGSIPGNWLYSRLDHANERHEAHVEQAQGKYAAISGEIERALQSPE